ncbi:MAG: hypothetical protein DWQ42_03050 [Planctomycetota bacterium]|nr:MAG: hypothetical protein DWQ42_03050 [Planctomycetota bacterium]REK47936.1 MAG: hypothetical protein DWQ46_03310 [Planctomycetota bacterium]
MAKKTRKNSDRLAALEICHSELDLLVIDLQKDGAKTVRSRTFTWRNEAPSLHTDAGLAELTAAFKVLATEEKLSGVPLYVALNGDFCVTRVVAGTADKVRRDLRPLEERANLYLSLGAGEKVLAAHIRQVDVRHQHGWLAVTNQRTLDALLAAADAAGLTLEVLEPSLVSLCRAVGHFEGDSESPVLIVAVDERGVELGVSFQGRLLLDYRPGGRQARDQIADIIKNHLERLQRYCDRHFGYAGGKISQVYMCGEPEAVQDVQAELKDVERLEVAVLAPEETCPDWNLAEVEEGTKVMPALGASLSIGLPASDRTGPNLLDRTRAGLREPLIRGMLATTWPIAAVLLMAIGISVAAWYERMHFEQLESRMHSMESDKRQYELLRVQFKATDEKLRHMRKLKDGLIQHPPHELATAVARCLPEGVWLDKLLVGNQGRVTLSGSSYSDQGPFEVVKWLRQTPYLSQVALDGTEPVSTRSGDFTRFNITGQLAERADYDGGEENND